MLGRILSGGRVDVVEGRDVDGHAYELARVELTLADGRITSGYIPVVEGEDDVKFLPLTDTQIDARSQVYDAIHGDRQ